jgi:hypothetical protein
MEENPYQSPTCDKNPYGKEKVRRYPMALRIGVTVAFAMIIADWFSYCQYSNVLCEPIFWLLIGTVAWTIYGIIKFVRSSRENRPELSDATGSDDSTTHH